MGPVGRQRCTSLPAGAAKSNVGSEASGHFRQMEIARSARSPPHAAIELTGLLAAALVPNQAILRGSVRQPGSDKNAEMKP
jgi:hypothetical protein